MIRINYRGIYMNEVEEKRILRRIDRQLELDVWKPRKGGPPRALEGLKISKENMEAIREFDEECITHGLELATRLHYIKELRPAAAILGKPFREANKKDLKRVVAEYSDGRKTKSENNFKIAVKRFYQWLRDMEDDEYPQEVKWMKPKPAKSLVTPKDLISDEEFDLLLGACNNQRDRAILQLLREEDYRPHELLGLRVGDVTPTKYGLIITVDGKTGPRTLPIIDSAPDIKLWLNMHQARDDPEAPLWYAFKKEGITPLSYEGLRNLFRRLQKKTKRRIYPMLVRHTALTDDAKKMKEPLLRKKAGWTPGSKMPAVYIHLAGLDVEEDVLQRRGIDPMEPEFPREPTPCSKCGQNNPYDAKYCLQCSAPLDPNFRYKEEEDKADLIRRIENLERTVNMLTMILARQGVTPLEAARRKP